MSGTSKIEWTDATWNPVTGCTKVSTGCKYCYAKTLHDKRHRAFLADKKMPAQYAQPFERVMLHPDRLDWPLHWRGSAVSKAQGRSSRIFVNSVSDLFHEDVPFSFLDAMFCIMALCPQHTFQILTKRAARMLEYVSAERRDVRAEYWDRVSELFFRDPQTACDRSHTRIDDVIVSRFSIWPLSNVWLGISAEDQKTFDERWPKLRETPAVIRFLSAEPLLGPIDATNSCNGFEFSDALRGRKWHDADHGANADTSRLDLVISGGESGRDARPSHPDHFRSLRDQCKAAGAHFVFKQWGEWAPETVACSKRTAKTALYISADGATRPAAYGARNGATTIQRMGKHATGRLLDGQLHNEYPASPLTTIKESP